MEDVVAELVVDQLLDDEMHSGLEVLGLLGLVAKLLDDLLVVLGEVAFEDLVDVSFGGVPGGGILGLEADLDDVAGELELAESDEVSGDLLDDEPVLLLVLELEDVLDQVVAVGVLDQVLNVVDDVVRELELLGSGALFEAPLHHTAAVLVLADLDAVLHASVEDELGVLAGELAAVQVLVGWAVGGFEDHEEGLDHVVAVHVHGQLNYALVEGVDDLGEGAVVDALVGHPVFVVLDDSEGESIDQGLDCSGAVEVQGDLDDVSDDSVDDQVDGLGVSDLDDFLAQVVAELVVHYSRDDWQHALNQALQESALAVLVGTIHGCLDHLLEHSAASLIEAIEVEVVEDLLLLLAEAGDHLLDGSSLLLLALLRSVLGLSIGA